MANTRKRIPYGLSDFETLRNDNCYYVDKTAYIRRLEEYNFALFLRPRRFGKSLFVNMLKAYYDVNFANKFDSLFGDLAIGKEPTQLHNTYLMLSFNFSIVDSAPANVQESFNKVALESIDKFIFRNSGNIPSETHKLVIESGINCAEALALLSSLVNRTSNKIYVVIDEYDNFANTLMTIDETAYQKILHADGFVRLFYNVLKEATTDNSAAIDRIFITGVSPLCLSDVTSGFNIAANLSTDPRFNAMVGFTESEVRNMLMYYAETDSIPPNAMESHLPLIKSYYDNYCFSEDSAESCEHLFNSDMTLYFVDKCIGRKGKTPKEMLDPNVKQDYNKIRMMVRYESKFGNKSKKMQTILNNGYILSQLNPEFQIRELADEKNLVSLLFYLGLLTYGKVKIERNGITNETVGLVVANEAMRLQYCTYLSQAYGEALQWRTDNDTMDNLWVDWIYYGQWEPMIRYIASVMHDNDSVRDFGPEGESFVKGFMLAHLCNGNGYAVRTEVEMGHGYSDIYLYPIVSDYPNALVLELKYLKPSASDDEVKAITEKAKAQVAQYVADNRLRTEAEARGWTLTAAVAVFRGWKAETVLAVNS